MTIAIEIKTSDYLVTDAIKVFKALGFKWTTNLNSEFIMRWNMYPLYIYPAQKVIRYSEPNLYNKNAYVIQFQGKL
jgi:hypothetical protein